MRTFRSALSFLLLAFVASRPFAAAQERPFPQRAGAAAGPALRAPWRLTFIPSGAGGDKGIAVGVLPPLRPRYAGGAPVAIFVPGGVDPGSTEGPPVYAGLGFVEIRFAFPGGGRGEGTSGGTYDARGPNCLRALADVIRFASGRLADRQGRKIDDWAGRTPVLTHNVGLVGSSHGGNACGMVMAIHGEEFPDLAFYASMESPYGMGSVNIELGGRGEGVNPAYDPETGVLDLSKLAWSPDLAPGPPRRWQGQETGFRGAFFFDLDGDGRYTEGKDFGANTFVLDAGRGPKAWYSPRLLEEAQKRKLLGSARPGHIPSVAESVEYWKWRDAAPSIPDAVRKCPGVAVIVYANESDHVQVAPDHPHILTQVEGYRKAGAKFVRLNPDRAYVERLLAAGGPAAEGRSFPDNDAGKAWDRGNIRTGLEPESFSQGLYMQAAVAELADRVQAKNWAKDLDAVLFPDAPAGAPRVLDREPRASPPAESGEPALRARVAADAGSTDAPLLFCIGVHVEPLGAVASKLAGQGGPEAKPGPSYEREPLFRRHLSDIDRLVGIVERQGGRLVLQVQTPFTRKLVESGNTLLRDLEKRGHEIALHFHEDAHMGRSGGSLPPSTWSAVMQEEIDLIAKAGATRIRYWSGGNLYPGVLEAAAGAHLSVMSDYKNPRTQRDDERLLSVNPWRPAAGPAEGDLAGFAKHSPTGAIVYLPNGVFDRTDHSAMRRSEEAGGDYAYFDAMTHALEMSLRAARSDRVNVFHITVHPGEFRGGPAASRPFAVIEDWLGEVVAPLARQGRVRWATFSEMADEFSKWEKANPGVAPRPYAKPADAPQAPAGPRPTLPVSARTSQPYITFAVNTHDWRFVDDSANTVLRLIGIFAQHNVRGDFYLTAPLVERYMEKRPDVIRRLKESGMTISYHVRPPHPLWRGFSEPFAGKEGGALVQVLRDYETFRLDLRTGGLDRDRPGGYRYVEQVFGRKPVAVGASDAPPQVKAASSRVYVEFGARVGVFHHETGTRPEQPFEFREGLLARPSDFSVTRFPAPGNPEGVFWWNMVGTPRAAEFDPVASLDRQLAAWDGDRAPFITALIHENDFYREGGPGWNAVYLEGAGPRSRPRSAPFDLDAPPTGRPRPAETREAIFRKYEELVARAAAKLRVVTSEDIAALAREPSNATRSEKASGAGPGSFVTGQDADLMLGGFGFNRSGGPLIFNHPTGLATDGKTLLMTDRWNNRVLLWGSAPAANTPPDLVLGQPDFAQNDPGAGKHQMNWPGNIAIAPDGRRIAVADTSNDRILIWNSFPTKNGEAADLVLDLARLSGGPPGPPRGGEGDRRERPAAPEAAAPRPRFGGGMRLGWPWGVWTDGAKLAVVATHGSAVLIWDRFPTRDDQVPDFVLRPEGAGTPRNVTSDGSTFFAVSDHNYGDRSRPSTMVWNSFPTSATQPYDFVWGEWVKGAFAADGRLILAGIQSVYLWRRTPRDAETDADVMLRPATYRNGDGPDAVVANGRLYVCSYNGNNLLVWNSIPTRSDQPPEFSIGSDRIGQDTWAENHFIQNPVVATDGRSLIVSSDFDRKVFVWRKLPEESAAKPDIVFQLREGPWDNELHGSTLAMAGKSTVYIWKRLPLNGEEPDVELSRRIGSVELGELTGVAFDEEYFYLSDRRSESIYVWQGIPDRDSEPTFTLPMRSPGRLTSDGQYLCAAPFEGSAIQLWRVGELDSGARAIPLGGRGQFNLPSECLIADGRLFVCNRGFNRVDVWDRVEDALAGRPADALLGATDEEDRKPGIGRDKLFMPGSLAWDGRSLWVGEFKFSTRILRFSPRRRGTGTPP